MTCTECKHSYHLGSCAGIVDSTFNTMGPVKREKWRCRTCRTGETRSSASQEEGSRVTAHLATIEQTLQSLMPLKDSVNSLLSLPHKIDQLLELKPTVELLKATVTEVQKSIDFLSEKYDQLLTCVTKNDKVIKDLQTETTTLRTTVSQQSAEIKTLQNELNENEQYSRLSNLEVHGLPCSPGENLHSVVCDLAVKVNLPIPQPGEILALHRLPAKKDSHPSVLVKFASVALRDKWLAARAKLRSLRESGTVQKVFFNENLTRAHSDLFWRARVKAREAMYRFVWVRRGKIFVKKSEGSPLVRVSCVGDLDKIN